MKLITNIMEIFLTLGLLFATFAIMNLFFMWGWNYLAPTFHLPLLSYWQTFVLGFICKWLFSEINYKGKKTK